MQDNINVNVSDEEVSFPDCSTFVTELLIHPEGYDIGSPDDDEWKMTSVKTDTKEANNIQALLM